MIKDDIILFMTEFPKMTYSNMISI
jgi:hypothetical protein